ncbi:phage portal protein [Paenibacillus sinopodophylli]|uniref:phage portal protein n=1 Tax=Paenibacillus sinopodophylli TaxID=1837342 RepID=UPI00110C989B|nr:phage portal protein [Paenibacillus sinopodophylli]
MAVVGNIPKLLSEYDSLDAARAAAPTWINDNNDWLKGVITSHETMLKENDVEKYQAAYDGYLETIKNRDKARGDDINHKIQATMAGLVIDFVVDYMLGKPIVWAFEDKEDGGKPDATKKKLLDEYRRDLLELIVNEEGQRVLREMLTQGSVSGQSASMGWVDEDGNIDYEEFPIQEVIPVYDTRNRLRLVIRAYEATIYEPGEAQPKTVTKVEVYDNRFVTWLISSDGTDYTLDANEAPADNVAAVFEHMAARIPVSVFLNGTPATYSERKKKSGVSDLSGGILDLVDEYANAISDKANLVDRLQDAFLVFIGATLGNTKTAAEGEVMAMRRARAIALKNGQSDAKFIAPPQDDTAVENYLDRLRDTLHEKGFIPKLSDLSGATATEIKVKYAGMDIKAGKKEVYFTGTIKRLVAILTDFINARRLVNDGKLDPKDVYAVLTGMTTPPSSVTLYASNWVDFTLNRNMPQNYLEVAQIVAQLAGIVPDSYLYELLWFIPDPKAALDEMKQQKDDASKAAAEAAAAAIGFGGEFGNTEKTGEDTED